uniref:Uncharacterized protein n=1 Tax=Meloidogyne incognita TaxID=6306 RepID=A0A914L0X4_MELIC
MLGRRLLPMKLDTGPGTRKSSTLCSLLLLRLVIATLLLCEVPGQMKEEFVGVANHKKIGYEVTLVNYTIELKETNFNSDEYRKRFPNACDVKIDNKTITTTSLDAQWQDSFNNIMPFVYGKSNKVVERLSHGPIYDYKEKCNKQTCGLCMPWTTLEISWSKSGGDVYAYTHLVGEVELGEKLRITQGGNEEVTFDMEVEGLGKFKMGPDSFKASKNVLCVLENNPIVQPETWTIANENFKNERLLVFSMLPVSASVGTHDGTKFAGTPPSGPNCDHFVQFDRNNYELLFVSLPPSTTTTKTTTTSTPKISSTETPETSTCAPCPSTTPVITTTTAKNISAPSTKYPAENKCPKESKGWLFYLILVAAIVGIIIIGILAWFTRSWMKVNSAKLKEIERERKEEEDVHALYKTEAKLIKNIKPFEEWKEDKKLEDQRAGLCSVPTEKLVGTLWKRIEKENAKDKMQFLADQFDKQKDKELCDREYALELAEKGYDAVGGFKEWKTENNIKPFEVIDGTSTAIEYGESRIVDKPLLPGASIDDKKRY